MTEPYDLNKPTPMAAPGGDWTSMAASVLPAGILGLLMGGGNPMMGLAGMGGAAAETMDDRERAIKYNNELAFKNQQAATEQERLAMERRRVALSESASARAEEAAKREMEAHNLSMQQRRLTYEEALKSQQGRERLAATIQDPAQRDLFNMNPAKYSEILLDNAKRADLTKRWANILPSFVDMPRGVDAEQVVDAFGEKIPEMIKWQQEYKLRQAELGEKQRDRAMLSANGELIITQKPDGTLKAQRVDDLLGKDFVSTKQMQDAMKRLEAVYKEDLSAKTMPFHEWLDLPQNKLMLALNTGTISPIQYGSAMAQIIKDNQQIEEAAAKQVAENWQKSRSFYNFKSKEAFDKFKLTTEYTTALEEARQQLRRQRESFSAPTIPTEKDLAPPPTAQQIPTDPAERKKFIDDYLKR